jgi:hypothetical protein
MRSSADHKEKACPHQQQMNQSKQTNKNPHAFVWRKLVRKKKHGI